MEDSIKKLEEKVNIMSLELSHLPKLDSLKNIEELKAVEPAEVCLDDESMVLGYSLGILGDNYNKYLIMSREKDMSGRIPGIKNIVWPLIGLASIKSYKRLYRP
jgi:hypothetical protein